MTDKMRNFAIIAHIDHGKSTLADRILEATGAVTDRQSKKQLLDDMDLERERGITIKLNAAQLTYNYDDTEYLLQLIDTPGHVDFSYEVSRSLAACEGVLLIVDAAQGIEAQTLANLYLALEHDLVIIPVINKIDLPNADVERVKDDLKQNFGFTDDEIIAVSAKTGAGIAEIMENIITKIPPPKIPTETTLQALIFDSFFDPYRGVIVNVRVFSGTIKVGDEIKMMASDAMYVVTSLGINTPFAVEKATLKAGEVGFVVANIKKIDDVMVGDTITNNKHPATQPLPGYQPMKSTVYCGFYPLENNKYEALKKALEKLKLNDAALVYTPENSQALGFGFRVGFLGLLHMEIVQERLKREFNLALITTTPSVIYHVYLNDDQMIKVENPTNLPEKTKIKEIHEPFVKLNVFVPAEYIGAVLEICQNRRGVYQTMEYLDEQRVNIYYHIPLLEIVYDFFEKLKSATSGYASFDYELSGYQKSDLVKMDILINGAVVDALSMIIHRDFAEKRGRALVENLQNLIPRQQFEVPIQASVGSKVIARSNVKPMRKNVLSKCYGGDITRKRKLLEKQKEGKRKMKKVGNVEIPEEAFLAVLSIDKD